MPNTNCLEGMACPNCKSEGPFRITTVCLMEWDDDGTEYPEQLEFAGNYLPAIDHVQCSNCEHIGTAADFGYPTKVAPSYTITVNYRDSRFDIRVPDELKGLVDFIVRDYDVEALDPEDLEVDENGDLFLSRTF